MKNNPIFTLSPLPAPLHPLRAIETLDLRGTESACSEKPSNPAHVCCAFVPFARSLVRTTLRIRSGTQTPICARLLFALVLWRERRGAPPLISKAGQKRAHWGTLGGPVPVFVPANATSKPLLSSTLQCPLPSFKHTQMPWRLQAPRQGTGFSVCVATVASTPMELRGLVHSCA